MTPYLVYTLGAVIGGLILLQMARRRFDPFEPIWLFLIGYFQVYVVQALTYRDWAVGARGQDLVAAADWRALWAVLWFLAVYYSGLGRWLARKLPAPPAGWSQAAVAVTSPLMIVWGIIAAGYLMKLGSMSSDDSAWLSPEEMLFRSFANLMLVGSILIIVSGRSGQRKPLVTALGVFLVLAYVAIWVFNGKRSPGLFGVLSLVAALYITKGKRPRLPVLAVTGVAGVLVVTLAIGWRGNAYYDPTVAGFSEYVSKLKFDDFLVNLNLKGRGEEDPAMASEVSYETEEYGGFLLMLDTVPDKSEYDYGESYLRIVTTYIVRMLWPNKPFFGRSQWVHAWMAGSQFRRDETFTGPAIGILGATQLNGGAVATAIVLAVIALLQRTSFEFFRAHQHLPWAQAWWALTYHYSWLMVVNDDPFVWFYYVYGHTTLPPMVFLWFFNRAFAPKTTIYDAAPESAAPLASATGVVGWT
jgi:hypothetical protein